MPIGRGYSPSSAGSAVVPNTTAEGDVQANAAVALVTDEGGNSRIVECSAVYHGEKFYGFARKSALDGNSIEVKTMRGSPITPLIENGSSLVTGSPVFLSRTPGQVSSSRPAEYESGAYGIEYTGGSAADPKTYTSPSGQTSSVNSVSNFSVPSGESWVFRALFKSSVNGNVRFRLTGNNARMWWNINARPETPDLDPSKALIEISQNINTTEESDIYTLSEGVTTPFVVAGGEGSLTFEWSINGGPWESDGSNVWLQYMKESIVQKPVVTQVGYAVSESSMVLITDLRIL